MTAPYASSWEHLTDELRWLDLLLQRAIAAGRATRSSDPFEQLRGLVVTNEEVDALLAGEVAEGGEPEVGAVAERLAALQGTIAARTAEGGDLALPRLAHRFQLTAFEHQALLLCLAPEVARKYDKLYAYLQDDVTRKRPTVGLALDLFCATPEERLAGRAAFTEGATLVRHRLLRVGEAGHDGPQPLLGRALRLDDRLASHLLGDDRLDPRLAGCARLTSPRAVPLAGPAAAVEGRVRELARGIAEGAVADRRHLLVHLRGPYGGGRRALAAAAAAELGWPLLTVEIERLPDSGLPFAEAVELLVREAFLQPAVLAVSGFDLLLADDPDRRRLLAALLEALATFGRLTFLLGSERWRPLDRPAGALLVEVVLPRADEAERAELWRRRLAERPAADSLASPEVLASEFRFTPGQIDDTLATAADLACWRGRPEGRIESQDLFDAARAQASPELGRLARRVEPRAGWSDLVLPADQVAQLRELCDQARHRATVLGAWGFGRKLAYGKGLAALFSGPPGTGKTFAASILAAELGLDLFKIDLSQVVSKYIGETEKNLDRIFTAAEDSSAILFFDEADALFGKRSEVRDSHDRYANVEVSYLLQKMEEHEGIAVLATNLRQHLDDAFVRRLSSVIDFPFPDAADRERIWRVSFPAAAPLGEMDFGSLAREVRLAGGNIKNISLAAAFSAAADGQVIRMPHLWHAARREFAKMGRTWAGPGGGSAS
ncbi:MAG: AAA family ATPase [Thermoanaerobaculia bacterium]